MYLSQVEDFVTCGWGGGRGGGWEKKAIVFSDSLYFFQRSQGFCRVFYVIL